MLFEKSFNHLILLKQDQRVFRGLYEFFFLCFLQYEKVEIGVFCSQNSNMIFIHRKMHKISKETRCCPLTLKNRRDMFVWILLCKHDCAFKYIGLSRSCSGRQFLHEHYLQQQCNLRNQDSSSSHLQGASYSFSFFLSFVFILKKNYHNLRLKTIKRWYQVSKLKGTS